MINSLSELPDGILLCCSHASTNEGLTPTRFGEIFFAYTLFSF